MLPFFTDLNDDSMGWKAMQDNSPTGKWDTWLLRADDTSSWREWLINDRAMLMEKNAKAKPTTSSGSSDTPVTGAAPTSFDRLLRVMVIRKDGKVGARTVGPPAWPKLLKQIQLLPQQDQYGTP